MTSVRAWFWKLVGGNVDADGVLRPDDDDPVVVFSGPPEEARAVKASLGAAGFSVEANARVADPRALAADLGVSARPSLVTLEVRAADVERAREVLARESSDSASSATSSATDIGDGE